MPALKAESLGSYRLVRKLGTGGMAEVFLAAQRMGGGLTRPTVIKAMLPHLAEDERFVDMFMREARVAAMLTHPNIVHIHDVTKLDGRPCIVMEFLKGRDLWTVLQRLGGSGFAVPPHPAATVIAQAASALDYAHRKRDRAGQPLDLVHRDISPHNLFLTREGHVKVLDFGIAKSAYQQQRTESGIIKGKLPYMAPEQARGKEVDGRADQFSLGVVLWEMVTGQRLFARDDPLATMSAMFHEPVPKPSSVKPVPETLERIIMRILRRSPTDRFDSCESLAHSLRTWLASEEAAAEARLLRRLLADAVPVKEDEEFYSADRPPDDDATSDEMKLVGIDLTPSTTGITAAPDELVEGRPRPPPPPVLTPTPPRPDSASRTKDKRMMVMLGAGGAALLALAFGITAVALSNGEEDALPPVASAPDDGTPEPVTVRFLGVPAGVTLRVDGTTLEGDHTLRVLPSDEVHHVQALFGTRELWRYDGLFRRNADVHLPPLSLPNEQPRNVEPDPEQEDTQEDEELGEELDEELDEETEEPPVMRPTMRPTLMHIRPPTIMHIRRVPMTMRITPRMTPRMTTRMTTRMSTRMNGMTLGMQLDLGYP